MRRKLLLVCIVLLTACMAAGHPLHISFTNLEYQADKSRWEVTFKVFSDDFANSLKLSSGFEGEIPRKTKSLEFKDIIVNWLTPLFAVSFDDREILISGWIFEGLRIQEDATWLTFSFSAPLPVHGVKIRNTIHFDIFADQKNLFIFTMGRFQSAFQFRHKEAETLIRLDK